MRLFLLNLLGARKLIAQKDSRIKQLETCLNSIIDGAVNPEVAQRRVMVDLEPIREVLGRPRNQS